MRFTLVVLSLTVAACSMPMAPTTVTPPRPTDRSQLAPAARFGADVCESLKTGLWEEANGTDLSVDISLYATERVLRVLLDENPYAQPGTEDEDISAWTDDETEPVETCNISAGGDAWYQLTLSMRPDDDPMYRTGQWATGLEVRTSYD